MISPQTTAPSETSAPSIFGASASSSRSTITIPPRIRIGRSSGRVAHAARAHDHARRGLLSARRPLSAPSVREKWRRAAGGEFPLVEEPQMSLPTVIHSRVDPAAVTKVRSEEHTTELQSLIHTQYAVSSLTQK